MIQNISQYKTKQYYPQLNTNNTSFGNNVLKQPGVDIGGAKLSTLKNNKFDYSKDDGKISTKDKAKNFLKGIISPVTNMFKSPKNLAIGAIAIAGGALLITATGGAIAPLMVVAGVVGGGIQLGTSAYKAATVTTDEEARLAWQGIGAGTTAIVGSVAGAKSSLKAANVEGVENMGMLKATIECFKQMPNSVSKSFKTFSSGEFIANISNSFKGNKKTEGNTPKEEISQQISELSTETYTTLSEEEFLELYYSQKPGEYKQLFFGQLEGSGNVQTQNYLRGKKYNIKNTDKINAIIKSADETFAKNHLERDCVLYRNTDNLDFLPKVGKTFLEKGYSSTSTSPQIARRYGPCKMEIITKKGTPVILDDAQAEVLLNRGSKFLVVEKTHNFAKLLLL